jgi:uncharacterized membrane protein
MKRSMLDQLVLEQRLTEPAVAMALDLSGARPDAAAWRQLALRLLNGAGIAALGAGVIFFVAANWQDYGMMGRFAIVQAGLAACVGLALWRPPPAPLGQAALTLAVLLTGALLALFGITYQTGADVYELFFAWALLALPFALASGAAPVWAAWWVVLNVGIALYCSVQQMSVLRFLIANRLGIERPLLLFFACVINFGGAVLFEHLGRARWLVRMLSTFGALYGTVAVIQVLVRNDFSQQEVLVVLLYAATCVALGLLAVRRRLDVFPLAVLFASWIAISTGFIIRSMHFKDIGPLFVVAIWLIGTSSAAGWLLMRWLREWKVAA